MSGRTVYAYVGGNPTTLLDPLGLWCWGDPIDDKWFNYSVGVADALSFGSGRLIRNFTNYSDEVETESADYRAGVVTGALVQGSIIAGAATAEVASNAKALFIAGQILVATGEITGATETGIAAVDALYAVGEIVTEGATEAALQAIRIQSTLRLTTVIW